MNRSRGQWDRGADRDRDREYGSRDVGSRGYGSDEPRDDYTSEFTGGGDGTGTRYGTGGSGRGGLGGGYPSGPDRSRAGWRSYQPYGNHPYGRSSGYSDIEGGGRGFRQNGYGDFNRGDYNRGPSGRGGWSDEDRGLAGRFDRGEDRGTYGSMEGGPQAGQGGRESGRMSFRGRGPKAYRRSDERIREDVCERLEQDHYVDATEVEVTVSASTVTLSGSVDDRDQKRRAEDIVESVSGVREVQNNLHIGWERSPGNQQIANNAATNARGAAGNMENSSSGDTGTNATSSSVGSNTSSGGSSSSKGRSR